MANEDFVEGGTNTSESYSYWNKVFQRLKKHKIAMVSLWILVVIILMAVFAKPLSLGNDPYTYIKSVPWAARPELAPPGPGHPLGLDSMGRDAWSRLLYGGRVSLAVGFICSFIGAAVGLFFGLISGYFGGVTDMLIMRFTDFMLSLPVLPLMVVLAAVIKGSLWTIIFIISIFSWMGVARLVRGEVLSLKEQEFTEAARAIGETPGRIMWIHLLPNSLAPVIVASTLAISGNIIYEATLSFLGLGIRQPTPSWGNMLNGAQTFMLTAPWLMWWPGLAIFITTLAFNFLGDGLRDALDPRLYR
jgi:peptide/nickel transport system permease protein